MQAAILPFKQQHGQSITTGYRIGDMAYSTDVKTVCRKEAFAERSRASSSGSSIAWATASIRRTLIWTSTWNGSRG